MTPTGDDGGLPAAAAGSAATYLSLISFVLATCASPGPNNVMIMWSGVTYGARRSIPHVIGINIGFPLMVIGVGLGLGQLLSRSPTVYDILRPVGAGYLLYLAYRIAVAPVTMGPAERGKPLAIWQSALFQLVNPKAWVMIVGAVLTYTASGNHYLVQVLIIALVFLVFGTPCTAAWLVLGVWLKRELQGLLRYLRAFNITMAALLSLSIVPIVVDIYRSYAD